VAGSAVRRHILEVGAECVSSACSDLCGGWSAMTIPTAIKPIPGCRRCFERGRQHVADAPSYLYTLTGEAGQDGRLREALQLADRTVKLADYVCMASSTAGHPIASAMVLQPRNRARSQPIFPSRRPLPYRLACAPGCQPVGTGPAAWRHRSLNS